MSNDIEFVNGLIVKAPNPKAPDFVKASISIKVADLKEWLAQKSDEWVNIDVKESKGGRWYAAVSQYKKEDKPQDKRGGSSTVGGKELEDDPLPF